MESAVQDSIATIIAKDTWSTEDHDQLMKELFQTVDAPRAHASDTGGHRDRQPRRQGRGAMKIGIARYMVSRLADALAALAEATDNKDRRWVRPACATRQMGQYAKAAEEFERAKDRGTDRTAVDAQLVEVQALGGDLDQARKALRSSAASSTPRPTWPTWTGSSTSSPASTTRRPRPMKKARAIDPGHANATFRLAYFCDLRGDEEKALDLYKECLAHPPVHASALMNMGRPV